MWRNDCLLLYVGQRLFLCFNVNFIKILLSLYMTLVQIQPQNTPPPSLSTHCARGYHQQHAHEEIIAHQWEDAQECCLPHLLTVVVMMMMMDWFDWHQWMLVDTDTIRSLLLGFWSYWAWLKLMRDGTRSRCNWQLSELRNIVLEFSCHNSSPRPERGTWFEPQRGIRYFPGNNHSGYPRSFRESFSQSRWELFQFSTCMINGSRCVGINTATGTRLLLKLCARALVIVAFSVNAVLLMSIMTESVAVTLLFCY